MTYAPISPFRRTLNAALMKHQARSSGPVPASGVNKWEVLKQLSAARSRYGLSDRDLAVLQALVSFHKETVLSGSGTELIVHPSNASICERLNGMPTSTMRRHLGRLVETGVLIRRDSPNGKRYVRRFGGEKITYGFDLSPLLHRSAEFCAAAEEIRAEAEAHKRLREAVSLMRRDLAALSLYGEDTLPGLPLWPQISDLAALTARNLRRKLSMDDLKQIEMALTEALDQARDTLEPDVQTADMSTSASTSEQQHQNSNKDSYESELCNEIGDTSEVSPTDQAPEKEKLPNLPLGLILRTCTEILNYAQAPVRHWHEFVKLADNLRPMMGITQTAWDDAKRHMGRAEAAVVLAAILERVSEIRSPGGYLRSLTAKAIAGEFSSGPMVMALNRRTV